MSYSASPRPTFDGPSHIPYETVTRHLWGDEESGEVADWIYVSSAKIHQLVFGLAPGGAFRHSDAYRTIFAADEVLYVLSGVMALSNPETGEVHRVKPGEAAFFRRDTWHHAFNFSPEPLRVTRVFRAAAFSGHVGFIRADEAEPDGAKVFAGSVAGPVAAGASGSHGQLYDTGSARGGSAVAVGGDGSAACWWEFWPRPSI